MVIENIIGFEGLTWVCSNKSTCFLMMAHVSCTATEWGSAICTLSAESRPVPTGEFHCSTVPERAGEENTAHAKGEKERTRSFNYERNVLFLGKEKKQL